VGTQTQGTASLINWDFRVFDPLLPPTPSTVHSMGRAGREGKDLGGVDIGQRPRLKPLNPQRESAPVRPRPREGVGNPSSGETRKSNQKCAEMPRGQDTDILILISESNMSQILI